jgi:hypothetical protein
MYRFGSLPENLIAFCAFLRDNYGFAIGPRYAHDAARALEIVDLADERAVRHVLRPVLSGTREDAACFDAAFSEFFFQGPSRVVESALFARPRALNRADENEPAPDRTRATATADTEIDESDGTVEGQLEPARPSEVGDSARGSLARASYSPYDADAAHGPEIRRADPEWRDAARSLVRRVHVGLSRSWRPSTKGQRFDLRRTLRVSLQTGGEPLMIRWLRRPKRAPRFVVLVDGSRSMSDAASTALELAVAIAAATMRIEAFTFSTGLRRVTDQVRRAAAGDTVRIDRLQHAWGGGTAIGECLRDFLRRFGDRLLGRQTLVVIASDGLDVGQPDVLRDAMREIRRRSAGVVWLNPLLETAGYEPTASGMLAARPYITTFAAVNDAAGFACLSRRVRIRM